MKTAIKEFFWLLGTLIVAWFTYGLIIGNTATDISLHNIYFVENGGIRNPTRMSMTLSWFILLGFVIYLMRVCYFEFKIIMPDAILIIFACLCLCFLSDVLFIIHPSGFLDRPTDSSGSSTSPSFSRYENPVYNWLPNLIKLFLIAVLALASFMVGRNFKTSK